MKRLRKEEDTYIQYCKGYKHLKNYLRERLNVNDIPSFTGLAHVDLKNLRIDNLQQQADGSQWIVLKKK
jgi:hypothetical protein